MTISINLYHNNELNLTNNNNIWGRGWLYSSGDNTGYSYGKGDGNSDGAGNDYGDSQGYGDGRE